MNNIIKHSFINALLTALYVALVAFVMRNGEKWFGKMDNILGPIAFLLLFVVSASITAALVLGRPILWYLSGQKKESIKLFFATLSWLLLFLLTLILIALV